MSCIVCLLQSIFVVLKYRYLHYQSIGIFIIKNCFSSTAHLKTDHIERIKQKRSDNNEMNEQLQHILTYYQYTYKNRKIAFNNFLGLALNAIFLHSSPLSVTLLFIPFIFISSFSQSICIFLGPTYSMTLTKREM